MKHIKKFSAASGCSLLAHVGYIALTALLFLITCLLEIPCNRDGIYVVFFLVSVRYSRREPNSHGFARQISASVADKMLAISYIASHFLFASAKYLLAQNCAAPSGAEFLMDFVKAS